MCIEFEVIVVSSPVCVCFLTVALAEPEGITLMIDNYDSFTYNIVQYLSQLGAKGASAYTSVKTIVQLSHTYICSLRFTHLVGLSHPMYVYRSFV